MTERRPVRSDPILTKRQQQKVHNEIMGLIGPSTSDADMRTISFVAGQVGRQTREEVEFCRHDVRGARDPSSSVRRRTFRAERS